MYRIARSFGNIVQDVIIIRTIDPSSRTPMLKENVRHVSMKNIRFVQRVSLNRAARVGFECVRYNKY